jgi:TatA/E family protein of Tat protein translocase
VFNIGPEEIILILVIALIVFGPKRLPEIGRTVGKSLREFRKASEDIRQELSLHLDDEPEAAPAAPATQLPAATTNGDGPAPEEHSSRAPDSGSVL